MVNNSVLVMGWNTNKTWLHGIKQDKRDIKIKPDDCLRNNGERISITFRSISSYLTKEGHIYG